MKLAAVCCTWCRPARLSYLIRCFEMQYHPDCELVILDDAGQYENHCGDRWRVVTTADRFPTLGAKRNAAVALASADVDAFAVFDDDDLYLPWALSAIDAGLQHATWTRPSLVLGLQENGDMLVCPSGGLFHAAWGFHRSAFEQVSGYPDMNSGEDQVLGARFVDAGLAWSDPIALGFAPYFVHCWADMWHLSAMDENGYEALGHLDRPFVGRIEPSYPPGVDIRNPRIVW